MKKKRIADQAARAKHREDIAIAAKEAREMQAYENQLQRDEMLRNQMKDERRTKVSILDIRIRIRTRTVWMRGYLDPDSDSDSIVKWKALERQRRREIKAYKKSQAQKQKAVQDRINRIKENQANELEAKEKALAERSPYGSVYGSVL